MIGKARSTAQVVALVAALLAVRGERPANAAWQPSADLQVTQSDEAPLPGEDGMSPELEPDAGESQPDTGDGEPLTCPASETPLELLV